MKRSGLSSVAGGLVLVAGGLLAVAGRGLAAEADAGMAGAVCRIARPAVPRRISPDIYGLAGAPLQVQTNACVPLVRWGGNTACRYNWKLGNAWNTGNDWFFENVRIEKDAWQGFLQRADQSGARALMTLPLIGFVAKDTQSHSFSVKKYGPQQQTDGYRSDAGNGVRADGSKVKANVRLDASVVADPAFVAAWVQQMQRDFPRLFAERRILFALGNEPMLWNVTHRDVHPEPVSYDEYFARFVAMAQVVRQVAPQARIAGPELWGWPAFFQSALDRDTKSNQDRKQHGGEDFLPWFLKRMRQHEQQTKVRLLDVVTVHFYPQAQGVHSADADPETVARRLETVRSLYDPGYRDPSWINERVELIPRLRRWVDQCYPGLQVGITEYNWGGEGDFSGALALANILGIFGREGLDLACYWSYPPPASSAAQAYRCYRNVDGAGGAFGDQLLEVTWVGPAVGWSGVTLYAAYEESRRMVTVMAVNQSGLARTVQVGVKGIAVRDGKVYYMTERTAGAPLTEAVVPVHDNVASVVLAPRSISHIRFPE
jgi:hypothetical protein